MRCPAGLYGLLVLPRSNLPPIAVERAAPGLSGISPPLARGGGKGAIFQGGALQAKEGKRQARQVTCQVTCRDGRHITPERACPQATCAGRSSSR